MRLACDMSVFNKSVIYFGFFLVSYVGCSIILVEDAKACFRRVLAGKRVTRALVKRTVFCERVEDCQLECAEEKRFACEGFNYRLDPTGRAKGECELLQIPLSHLDIGRDLYPDPDYDYYERDRNAASVNCRRYTSDRDRDRYHEYGYDDNRHYGGASGYHRRPEYDRWSGNRYDNRRPSRPDYDYDRRRPVTGGGYDYHDSGYRGNANRRGDFAYHHSHHSQQSFEHSHNYHNQYSDDRGYDNYHYLPPSHYQPPPYDYKHYEPYLPPNRRPHGYGTKYYVDRERDRNYWGIQKPAWGSYGTNYNLQDFEKRNYYLPPTTNHSNKYWGQYGGSYGTGGAGINLQYTGYGHSQSFDFWGLQKYEEKFHNYGELPPYKHSYLPNPPINSGSYLPKPLKPPSYLPDPPPSNTGSYLPKPIKPPSYLPEPPPVSSGSYFPKPPSYLPQSPTSVGNYLPVRPPSYIPEPPNPPVSSGGYPPSRGGSHPRPQNEIYLNSILPAEPRFPPYDFIKDECSLRSAAGFRLHKGIVKKFYAVPNIYECELLCFKEKDFPCASYAYRYTISLTAPTDNCYLSNRNYKELDFYTDLQPDRDFDIYTMNNQKMCELPVIKGHDNSECFWRVRSGHRLDGKVVRDSLTVKSIVECQLECLRTTRFTCRAFSFRYGSPTIGGAIDNCQLTDWPYYELDPRLHFVPEPGFELYERGSFGHGCEPDHFGIRGKPWKTQTSRINEICYVGFGAPARLAPQAVRKAIYVPTEQDCKAECTKLRDTTLFQCLSFSYRTGPSNSKWEPNCLMSDILQRDLLPSVDCIPDPDWWLFAWDSYNPECLALAHDPVSNHIGKDGGFENRHGYDPNTALDTWRVYSVSGWPCRRGSLCQENREAGFWFCELEGGDRNTWDYCCRPNHQCGFSEGFSYQWCYVGPSRTQWRKCSDRYYPYIHNLIYDRFDATPPYWTPGSSNYIPDHRPPPPPHRPGARPDRPLPPPTRPPPRPSLDEYEMQFDSQFLDPPRPGGFGQPRHWPLSYLHKESPPNNTDSEPRLIQAMKGRGENPKLAAIQNLIDIIKSNDLKKFEYQFSNESNDMDDILYVKIPLPTNFTQETKKKENFVMLNETGVASDPVDIFDDVKNNTKRSQKSLPVYQDGFVPIYRKSYITRTNVTRSSRRIDS